METETKVTPSIYSETGKLKAVITHFPGVEIEKMTPTSAKDALYSDILNLKVAAVEYGLFRKALQIHSHVYEIKDLLEEALLEKEAVDFLLDNLKKTDNITNETLLALKDLDAKHLAQAIIEGYPLGAVREFEITPAYNLFFTRDITVVHHNMVLFPKMASKVRAKESLISKTIFKYHPSFLIDENHLADANEEPGNLKFEGGDIHIFSEDITLIGTGVRTNEQGIDFIIKNTSKHKKHTYIIQQLPHSPESFIHLDMVFSMLSANECMIYKPVFDSDQYKATIIEAENGQILSKKETINLLEALKELGHELNPIYCGNADSLYSHREQWHSGANFFSLGNGKIIGYERNTYTINALAKAGYEVIPAENIDNYKLEKIEKYVITFPGNELSRGGGGARCMTMPVTRSK